MIDDVQQLMAGRPEYAPENDPAALRDQVESLTQWIKVANGVIEAQALEIERLEEAVINTVSASFENISNA